MKERRTLRATVWWRAFRYHFVPPSIFPAILGGIISWAAGHAFSSWYFLLVLVAIVFNHIGLNMTDDYFDYKHSVDSLKLGEKNPYTGGSGTLSSGLIAPASMFKAFTICYIITASIGIYLSLTRGMPVLAFGLIGGFSSIFYTAPPISFSHRGLGELALLINFGTIIGLGSYFVQAQQLTLEAFVATLPMGIMLFSMIIINEIPDLEQDRNAGKLTLVARYGRKAGMKIYVASWISTYSIIIGGILLGILPIFTVVSVLSIPLAYRSTRTLIARIDSPLLLAPANLDMIKAHSLTGLGLVVGYSIQGFVNNASSIDLLFIWLIFAATYTPAALSIFRRGKKNKEE